MAFAPTPNIEQAPAVEPKVEAAPSVQPEQPSPATHERPATPHPADTDTATQPKPKPVVEIQKDATLKAIEEVLSQDQADIVAELGEIERQAYILKGEELAVTLRSELSKPEVDLEQVDAAIKSWLMLIPGQNEFHVEQHAINKREQLIELRQA